MKSTINTHPNETDRYCRIRDSIDVDRMAQSHVVTIGSANDLMIGLCRSGLGRVTAIDFDTVSEHNVARQDFDLCDQERLKVDVLRESIQQVNPDASVTALDRDVTTLNESEIDEHIADADLIICGVDDFAAHKWTNLISVRLGIPSMFISLYAGGRAAEIIHQVPGTACYRCVAGKRYAYFDNTEDSKTPSTGGTIHDLRILDSVASHIAVGILTQGAPNRFGRLIDSMDDRTFTLIKIDPAFTLSGNDVFRDRLGNDPANFCWTPICLPMDPEDSCPDCGGRGIGASA